jgi:hypothetical protein
MVRELHVYGNMTPVDQNHVNGTSAQHRGFGKMLMKKAEEIALENGYNKIAVISGVGVREYYRKLGYKLEGAYMTKRISYYSLIMNIIMLFCINYSLFVLVFYFLPLKDLGLVYQFITSYI